MSQSAPDPPRLPDTPWLTMHHHIAAGRAARRHGDAQAALDAFAAAMLLDKRREPAFIEYGEELRRQQRLDEATRTASEVLSRHPASLGALLLAGRCARDRGDPTGALTHFAQAAALDSNDPAPFTELAQEQRKTGRHAEAQANYRRAMALDPARLLPYLGLARCARAAGDPAASLAWHRRAAEVAPSDLSVRVEIANDLRELERLEDAAAAYHAILAADPGNYAALMGRAALARRTGDIPAALRAFSAAATARPAELAPMLGQIALHRDLGALDAAESLAQAVLRQWPLLAVGHIQIGWIARSRGDPPAAFAAFARARQIEPHNVDAIVQMAVERRATGDSAGSEALFAEALAIDPAHGGALVQSGLHALAANDHADALDRFQRVSGGGSQQVQACLGACESLARLGRTAEAFATLDSAESRFGANPSLTARRIALLRELGDLPAALAAAEAALPASAGHFGLFVAVMRVLLLAGSAAQIDACLSAARPVTERDRILHLVMQGFAAEETGDLPHAHDLFAQAVALRAHESGAYLDLTRIALLGFDPEAALVAMRRNRALAAPEARLLGHSDHVSQTHYGQMIDEYRMDRPLLDSVRALAARPPEDRLAGLLDLAAAEPGSTLVAVAVVDALWRTDQFHTTPPPPGPSPPQIPKRIFQYWDAPQPPPDVAHLMESWAAHNPGYTYRRYSDREARKFLWDVYGLDAAHAYHRARQPAHKADLFRLALLLKHGGIYADADDRCIAPLSTIIGAHDRFVVHREDLGTLGNNFIAVTPHHPLIRRALTDAIESTNRGDNDLLWFSTGPGLITRSFVADLATHPDRATALHTTRILSRRALHRAVAAHCRTAYKKTALHWENTAFARKLKGSAGEARGGQARPVAPRS